MARVAPASGVTCSMPGLSATTPSAASCPKLRLHLVQQRPGQRPEVEAEVAHHPLDAVRRSRSWAPGARPRQTGNWPSSIAAT